MKSGLKNIKDQLTATTRKDLVREHIVKEEKRKINIYFFDKLYKFYYKY